MLIGDSLGDPKMVGGLKRVDHVIKIGFLNHDVSILYYVQIKLFLCCVMVYIFS